MRDVVQRNSALRRMTEAETSGATEFVIHVQIVMTGFATVAIGALDALFASVLEMRVWLGWVYSDNENKEDR